MANDEDKLAHAREQAKSQYESISGMVAALNRAREIEQGEFDWEEEAERLGFTQVNVPDEDGNDNTKWAKPGFSTEPGETTAHFDSAEDACRAAAPDDYLDEDEARQRIEEDALSVEVRSGWHNIGDKLEPSEFRILLCTGGPAVQIRGELNEHNDPELACLECQDWFTPWTRYPDVDQETLLAYARVFYFGE